MNDIRLWTKDVVIKICITNTPKLSKGISINYSQMNLFDFGYLAG